ncbi:vesicular inhibitory amino acid transporter-like [Mercenaria mercenaria]|uniref:vesicular inhibitory amino acid transporter-like n=1 Tax=Mercenaria mercenaria TaxID=6596 RepID=UPI00234E420E|nr:vesicular inhibitory amino acid transporter-like [Mercenaria mercenaria]
MFIVSFPYAVLQGGYWAIIAMVLVAYICCYTGKILVQCLYEEDETGKRVRVRNSYVEVAEEVLGKTIGGKIVNCAQIIELLMTCILYVLLCGDLLDGSFPGLIDLSSWIVLSTFFLLPCAFLQTLQSVSWLSFWCTVAHMAINAIIIIFCLTRASVWKWSEVQLKIDIWTFPISLGIIVFSYTSQIFLPTLEGNLVNRKKFSCMMHATHASAAGFKAIFSYIGFLTWGVATQEVITNNLPTQTFKIIVNVILVAKALLSYPLPYFAAVELIETALFQGRGISVFPSCLNDKKELKIWAIALRFGLVLFTMLLAIGIPYFAILMSLIGSFTGTMLSFVWPCHFHLRLRWYRMKWYEKATDIIIILLGLVFGSIGIYYSAHALAQAVHGLPTDPYKTHMPVAPKLVKISEPKSDNN